VGQKLPEQLKSLIQYRASVGKVTYPAGLVNQCTSPEIVREIEDN